MDGFDGARLDSDFNGLHTPKDRAMLSSVVMDYMEYVRSRPEAEVGWDPEKGKLDAMKFVGLINNDRGWPLARQFVPEFQQTTEHLQDLPELMRYVLRCIQPRTIPVKLEVSDPQRAEEDLVWRRTVHSIEYLAYLGQDIAHVHPDRQKEVQECLRTLQTVTGLVQADAAARTSEPSAVPFVATQVVEQAPISHLPPEVPTEIDVARRDLTAVAAVEATPARGVRTRKIKRSRRTDK